MPRLNDKRCVITGAEREARMQALVADTPLKRFGTPEEVAALALLLASDDAACSAASPGRKA